MIATYLKNRFLRLLNLSLSPRISEDNQRNEQRSIRRLSSLKELDRVLQEVDAAAAISDDAMRKVFNTFEFSIDIACLPPDPFSETYKDFQFGLYQKISGREYHVANEMCDFANEKHIHVPFPYYTESFQTVSDHLLMLGLIIKELALPPKASILEFGPGWGNTTLALAQMGYRITVIDIEQRYIDLIARRCHGLDNRPKLIQGDFAKVQDLVETFDAVLFYESFHHCSDHNELLRLLLNRLAPGGRVIFAAEPINEAFPMPWGVRLDGMSLWSIRRFGWLELGFSEKYFLEALRRSGFKVEKKNYPVTALGVIFVAHHAG